MAKKAALVLALVMLAVVIWGLFFEAGATHIVINGQELTGPLEGGIGAAGFIVGLFAVFCAAIFLLFVFAGIGVFILACVVFAGLIAAGFAFPFLLVLLIPLAVLWAFIALIRSSGA
jgi:hypothetical protein